MHIARHLRHVQKSTSYVKSAGGWRAPIEVERFANCPVPFTPEGYALQLGKAVPGGTGYVRVFEVWRVNTKTGEYRKRTVRRRVKYMKGHRGFLSVNDGVAAAADIARLVTHYADEQERDWFDVGSRPTSGPPDSELTAEQWQSSMLDVMYADAQRWQEHGHVGGRSDLTTSS